MTFLYYNKAVSSSPQVKCLCNATTHIETQGEKLSHSMLTVNGSNTKGLKAYFHYGFAALRFAAIVRDSL